MIMDDLLNHDGFVYRIEIDSISYSLSRKTYTVTLSTDNMEPMEYEFKFNLVLPCAETKLKDHFETELSAYNHMFSTDTKHLLGTIVNAGKMFAYDLIRHNISLFNAGNYTLTDKEVDEILSLFKNVDDIDFETKKVRDKLISIKLTRGI